MKLIPLLIALTISTAVTAKTTTLVCETKPVSIPGTNGGPGSRSNSQNNLVSSWRVVMETDQAGSVTGVRLNDETKKFAQKGDLVSFSASILSNLEINMQSGQARTTITGYDTAEQGNCKVMSVTGASVASPTVAPAMAIPGALAPTAVEATAAQAVNKEANAIVVNEIQVSDSEKYKEYVSKLRASLAAFGGVLIVKGENSSALDGSKSGNSIAIVQFPNRTKAMQWYVSDEYQKILKNANTVYSTRVYSVD